MTDSNPEESSVAACDVNVDNSGGDLNRSLKNRHVQLIALGGIIGSCFFLGTGQVVGAVGPAAFLAYVLGAIIIYLVMNCLGELTVAVPITGSFVAYAAEFISPTWACGVGWAYWLNWVAYIPGECTAAGIIMNGFFPEINQWYWAFGLGIIITLINVGNVKNFGETAFWLAICEIFGIGFFCVMAILIFFGIIHGNQPAHIIGTKYLLGKGGLFPLGAFAVLTEMVMLLVNFQGSEIIGLSASECNEPGKAIPVAIKNVTFRLICMYLIPVFLLVLILPWTDANVGQSVFATALNKYGLHWAGGLFSLVALTASMSCANSGLYGTVRSLYALALEGMAPRFLAKLNSNAVPANATVATIVCIWICLLISIFFSARQTFVALLSISGFTGTICWISICWSQYNFRKRFYKAGYTDEALKFKAPGFPYTSQAAILIQVACLAFSLFNESLRIAFYLGLPCLIIPMILYLFVKKDYKKRITDATDLSNFEDILSCNEE